MKSRYWYFRHGEYGMGDEELRPIGEHEFLVKTTRTLVSVGTEVACNAAKLAWKEGRHGYSHAGIVIDVGKSVKDVKIGDRVFGERHHAEYAVYNTAGANPDLFLKIPSSVRDEEVIYLALGSVGFHAIERGRLSMGQPTIVVGQGTVGQLAQQLAHNAGAGMVIAVDIDEARLDLSRRLGADMAIKPDAQALANALATLPAGAPAPAFIEVSGSAAAVSWIFDVAPLRSRIVLAGGHGQEITISPSKLIARELDIHGAHGPKLATEPHLFYPYNLRFAFGYMMDLLAKKRLRVGELSDGAISPDQLMSYYDASRDGEAAPEATDYSVGLNGIVCP